MTVYLALDIGTTGMKAALITDAGEVVRSATSEYPTHRDEDGVIEQNPVDWWAAIVETCRALNAQTEAQAIAITGQMQNIILLGADANPIRPAILYSDTRAYKEAEVVNERAGAGNLRRLTGNNQGADSVLVKLLWLHRHEPESLRAAETLILGAADYAAFKMTGEAVTDTTTASTTGLMALNLRQIMNPAKLNLPELEPYARMLPPLAPGGAKAGTLTAEAAKQLNLREGLPVFHGPGDAGAATLGAGSGEPGPAYAYLGTSGWVAFTAAMPGKPENGVITLAHPRTTNTIQVAPLLTAGGNLNWVRDLFDVEFDALVAAAAEQPPTKVLYLPYLNGERSPFGDPLARAAFIGVNARADRATLTRAVLEGVAYAYRHAMEALMPQAPTQIMLIGGGARSELWSQVLADVVGIDVWVPDDAENIGLYGAVLAAEVQRGERHDYHVKLASGKTFSPNAAHHQHYEPLFQAFKAAYPALKPIFDAIH